MDNPHNIIVDKRPWGDFRQYTKNELVTVKVITVKEGEAFSLQYHNSRDEFWRILEGEARVTVGEDIMEAGKDSEFYVPAKTNHRLEAVAGNVSFLEISYGNFDESDIVRLEDKYGRS